MKLQIALDMVNAETAVNMVQEIHKVIDIVEVGTPMILREGMLPVRLIKESFPNVKVLADTKIVDGGSIESRDAFEAGADIVTVLAVSDDATIQAVADTAKIYKRQVMADMICIENVEKRAVELDAMNLDYICIHTALDVQKTGKTPFAELTRVISVLKNSTAAVAGGINKETILLVKNIGPEIVIIGGALTKADNLMMATLEMKELIQS